MADLVALPTEHETLTRISLFLHLKNKAWEIKIINSNVHIFV